jgi:EAL and modified HD-GYP domain-containing signal transduction protein
VTSTLEPNGLAVRRPPASPTSPTALARQPIVDRHGRAYGYELLFRGPGPTGDTPAGDRATAGVLVGAACDIGWAALGGGRPLFVNVGTGMLHDPVLELAPPQATVLEVLEDVDVDDATIGRVQELRALGYDIALDDFVAGSSAERLVHLARFVKVDVLATPSTTYEPLVARLHGGGAVVVAEKIEDAQTFRRCVEAGFDLFQGYWFARPAEQQAMDLSPHRVVCLQLLALLAQEETDPREIESLVMADAALVVRTLRMANSAAVGAGREISSVRQAVMMVGPKALSGWVALMLMAHGPGENPLTAAEVLVRARACEIVASGRPGTPAGVAFLAGLASGLVDLGGVHADGLLDAIGASDEIRRAVLTRTGPVGDIVASVFAHVGGRDEDADISVQLAHLAALAWFGQLRQLA